MINKGKKATRLILCPFYDPVALNMALLPFTGETNVVKLIDASGSVHDPNVSLPFPKGRAEPLTPVVHDFADRQRGAAKGNEKWHAPLIALHVNGASEVTAHR